MAFIDQQIRQGWTDNEVQPSALADDEEWFRRVHLDLVGHIPAWNEIERFHRDKNPAKRAALVDKLLDSPGYVRNWTTLWTNLTIGRKKVRFVNRTGMERFFREAFAQNRPWNEIVHDLVAAEGRSDENGAVNYLLAQMVNNDEAVQATAKTTRLVHGHPGAMHPVPQPSVQRMETGPVLADQQLSAADAAAQSSQVRLGTAGGRSTITPSSSPATSRDPCSSRSAAARCRSPIRSSTTPKSTRVPKRIAAASWPA